MPGHQITCAACGEAVWTRRAAVCDRCYHRRRYLAAPVRVCRLCGGEYRSLRVACCDACYYLRSKGEPMTNQQQEQGRSVVRLVVTVSGRGTGSATSTVRVV